MAAVKRRRLRLLGAITGSAVLLLLLLVAALHAPPVKRFVLSQVTRLLADSQIVFTARRLDYNLFNLSLVLEDVTLRAVGADEAPAFAHIDRATVDLSLLRLLRMQYVVEQGSVTRPTIHVVLDDSGRSNLPQLPESEETSAEPVDYLIRQFSITDAQMRFEDRRQRLDVRLPVTRIDVQGQQISRHHVRLAAGGGQVRLQDRQADIERIAGDLVIDRDAIRVNQLEVGATGTRVALSGTLMEFENPRYDLALNADLDVEPLAMFAGVPDAAGGSVRAEVTARGPLETLTAEATRERHRLELSQSREACSSLRRPPTIGQRSRLGSRNWQSRRPSATSTAQGAIALNADAGTSQLDVDLRALDLDHLMRALDLPYVAATRAGGRITARWPGLEYARADGDGQITLTPTRTGSVTERPSGGRQTDRRGTRSARGARYPGTPRAGRGAGWPRHAR